MEKIFELLKFASKKTGKRLAIVIQCDHSGHFEGWQGEFVGQGFRNVADLIIFEPSNGEIIEGSKKIL